MTPHLDTTPDLKIPKTEIRYNFSRSAGPGGQNVNKVSTRVDLLFDVRNSSGLNDEQKRSIMANLASRIDSGGVLRVTAQASRSQWRNREDARGKLIALLQWALARRKKRIGTRPTATVRKRRAERKRRQSEKKKLRAVVPSRDL